MNNHLNHQEGLSQPLIRDPVESWIMWNTNSITMGSSVYILNLQLLILTSQEFYFSLTWKERNKLFKIWTWPYHRNTYETEVGKYKFSFSKSGHCGKRYFNKCSRDTSTCCLEMHTTTSLSLPISAWQTRLNLVFSSRVGQTWLAQKSQLYAALPYVLHMYYVIHPVMYVMHSLCNTFSDILLVGWNWLCLEHLYHKKLANASDKATNAADSFSLHPHPCFKIKSWSS